jgi:hypothetical protein
MQINSKLLGGVCVGVSALMPVLAQAQSNTDPDQLDRMQRQMEQLQQQIKSLKSEMAEAKKKQAQAADTRPIDPQAVEGAYGADYPAKAKPARFVDSIRITPSGFIEAAGIWRTRNEVADMASDFNTGIPFPISPLYHENELRFSARQSRLALLAEGNISQWQLINAYFEMDFLGAATTANSRESNSYTPRLRQGFLSYDDTANGWHVLAGQAWSLLTQNTVGITPRKENIPLTIDAQYAVGFNWTRNAQIRVVKDFGQTLWLGVSAESPQAVFQSPGAPTPFGMLVNDANQGSGSGLLNTTTSYSTDTIPDFVEKVAWDPGGGSHFEVVGLERFFTDRVQLCTVATTACTGANVPLGPASNHTTNGWGVGGSVLVPVLPKFLDLQGSILYGQGIGRYGSGQLADVTIAPNGSLTALTELQSLIGAVMHVTPDLDLYTYAGLEHANASFTENAAGLVGNNLGYGNPNYSDAACAIENYGGPFAPAVGSSAITASEGNAACSVNTKQLTELTGGFWYTMYRGAWGRLVGGMQFEYIHREVYDALTPVAKSATLPALAANVSPATDIGILMTSLRFYF